jgi:hypothetical protein
MSLTDTTGTTVATSMMKDCPGAAFGVGVMLTGIAITYAAVGKQIMERAMKEMGSDGRRDVADLLRIFR